MNACDHPPRRCSRCGQTEDTSRTNPSGGCLALGADATSYPARHDFGESNVAFWKPARRTERPLRARVPQKTWPKPQEWY